MKRLVLVLALAACWSKPTRVPDDGIDDPITLAAGRKHACAINSDGHLRCWGNNEHGQLGERTEVRSGMPAPVQAMEQTWTWVAAGDSHTCAINDANELYCWGDDTNGQVGDQGQPHAMVVKIPLPDGATPAKIYAGYYATCSIDDAGHLYCWGIYDLDLAVHKKPVHVMPGGNDGPWRSVAIGEGHVCALNDRDNQAYCWGKNMYGELGVPDDHALDSAQPKRDREFVALSAGHEATCGITIDRKLVCFGNTERGLIGPAPDAARHEDFEVDSARRWTAVAVGYYHTCAIGDVGVYCFGVDERGALGTEHGQEGTGFDQRRTLPDDNLVFANHVVSGESYSCARTGDGLVCWGSSSDGELGNGEIATVRDRFTLSTFVIPVTISTGTGHTCAVTVESSVRVVYCWGDNRKGQAIPNGPPFILTPTKVDAINGGNLDLVALGSEHTCAREPAAPAKVHCWGSNTSAQLGSVNGLVDVTIATGGTAWANMVAGDKTTCAFDDANNVACWGNLPGTMQNSRPPTRAQGSFKSAMALGGQVLLAENVLADTVAMGANPALGCNPDESFPMSRIVVPATDPSDDLDLAQAPGGNHGCRIRKTPGAADIWCWGENEAAQAGEAASACSMPHAVLPPLGKAWTTSAERGIATGSHHSCAIGSDQKLYCWGHNDHGEIGDLTGTSEVPRQAISGGFKYIVSGPFHMCGLSASDTTTDCWGENRFGEVGNGLRFHPDPVAVLGL